MLALVVPAAMAVSLLSAEPILQIAVPGLSVVNLPNKSAEFFSEHLAQELGAVGARVMSSRQITAVLGIDRQRQMLDCTDAVSACMAELTNALGVDVVAIGDVAKLEKSFQLNLKLISAKNAQSLSVYSARLDSEEAVLDEMGVAAAQMASDVARKLNRMLAPSDAGRIHRTTGRTGGPRRWAWIPAAVGLVAAGGGTFAAVQASSRYQELTGTPNLDAGRAAVLRDEGNTWKVATQVGVGVGAAGLVAGAALWLLGDAGKPVPTAALGPSGVSIGLTWRLP